MNFVIRPIKLLLVALVLISAVGLSFRLVRDSVASASTASSSSMVYLPITIKGYPRPVTGFGAQILPHKSTKVMGFLKEADVYWVRVNAINWNDIEPDPHTDPPTYKWEMVNESGLSFAAKNGMQIIATVRFAPAWAQKIPGYACGPISPEALDEFAKFLHALVQRYSYPPYNIKYWELGNEPDIDYRLADQNSGFGCWGDENDQFYGGGYYAEMLKVAYPAIKAVDPTAQVLIGGLLLDCDPTHPPEGKDCKPTRFLEGILINGGGPFFDIVSFHGYPTYSSSSPDGELYYDPNFPSWGARGGVVLGKVDFLREVLAQYGLAKPIMHTEGSLICPETNGADCNPPIEAFFQAQADYIVWLYVRNWAAGLKGTIWYQFNGSGWRYGSILDGNQDPKPVYYALDFLTQELKGATYVAPVTQFPSIVGYEFRNATKKIWVLWSPGAGTYAIQLPGGVLQVYDKYGTDITPAGPEINVKSPIYVEFAP